MSFWCCCATGHTVTGCVCTAIPTTLHQTMTGTDFTGILNPCTYTWQATPPWAPVGSPNAFWSEYFDFATYGGVNNWHYKLTCGTGAYFVNRVVAPGSSAATGSSLGNVWRWSPGFGGNTCSPFAMVSGTSQIGGSYTTYNLQVNA